MILDTNAISALFSGHAGLESLLSSTSKHHVPVIVLGEYRFGLQMSSRKKKLESLLDVLEQESYLLDIDSATARQYAQIRWDLRRTGTPIPENDIWIASLAKQHHLVIVSNDKHFDSVTGIKRKGWE